MFSCPGNLDPSKRYIPLIYLVLIGMLVILPSSMSAEDAGINKKAGKLRHGARVAILPFENMSGQFLDIDEVMKPFYQNLGKIFSYSHIEKVDETIWQLRLRHTGFLTSQEALEIGQRLGVEAIVLGMICLYNDAPEPCIGLIMKVIGTGEETPILWSKSINKSSSLTRTWFGINSINMAESLIDRVAKEAAEEISINLIQRDVGLEY